MSASISVYLFPFLGVNAQSSQIVWNIPMNLSNTPDKTSTDPFIVSDQYGLVHLFWAEKVMDIPGNSPDTLMYSVLDGDNWSKPIDIHFAPLSHGNPIVNYPHAAIDSTGRIHLVWLTQPNFPNYSLYYSSAHSLATLSSNDWSSPVSLADDLTGTNYSLDIKIDSEQNIHIIYARVPAGDRPPELRSVTYIKSTDNGKSWSQPIDLFTVSDQSSGASNTKLLIGDSGGVFASWTEWNKDGIGVAIYFTRSLDQGVTWETPRALTRRIGIEYERDWNNMFLLSPDTIVSVWEGGFRAYRHAMYSYDQGMNWSEPIDTYPRLIGENGYAEFATDSLGRVMLIISQRIREGFEGQGIEGLWYSHWLGGQKWSEPLMIPQTAGLLNPKITIVGGNKVLATWLTSPELEIYTVTGKIIDAPALPLESRTVSGYPSPDGEELTLTPVSTANLPTSEETPIPPPLDFSDTSPVEGYTGANVLYSLVPSVLIIILSVIFVLKFNQNKYRS